MKNRSFFAVLFATGLTHVATGSAHADIADITPAAACNYLMTIGLPTTTYRQQTDGVYRCTSPAIDIGTLNNITYSATGSEKSISEIKLTINVNNVDEAGAIYRRLGDVANTLARKLGVDLPASIQKNIKTGNAAEATVNNRRVSVARIDQAGGGGYAVIVSFK